MREDEHQTDMLVTVRKGHILPKHLIDGQPPQFVMRWDRCVCDHGAWRTMCDSKCTRIAPAKGVNKRLTIRSILENLLSEDAA